MEEIKGSRMIKVKCRKVIGREWILNRVVEGGSEPSNEALIAKSSGSCERKLDGFIDESNGWVYLCMFYQGDCHVKA